MEKHFFFFICICIVLFSPQRSDAGLKVLEGSHTVVYDIVNPRGVAFIPDYSNESFEQKVENLDEFSKRVTITSKMGPLKTRVQYPIDRQRLPPAVTSYLLPERDRQAKDPSLARLAREITRNSRFAHEAADAILSWIADNIVFDTSITVPNDAVSAFQNKKAYCVGYSNLAVALMRAAGIPARVAHGYLPPGYEWGFSKEYWGVKINDGGYHAYVEIYYPDLGWVFSDAEHSHQFVDPFHIFLRLDGLELPGAYKGGYLDVDKATFYTIYRENNKTVMVDELPVPREKRLGRRLDERQHSALVSGRVIDQEGQAVPKGTVVLWKDGKGVPVSFEDGQYAATFPGSGNYRLELRGPGFARSSRELQVEQGKTYHVNFTLQPGGVIKGIIRDKSGKPVAEGDVFHKEGNSSIGVPIDKDGSYRIEGLAPGQYSLSVMIGEKTVSRSATAVQGSETILDFVIQ